MRTPYGLERELSEEGLDDGRDRRFAESAEVQGGDRDAGRLIKQLLVEGIDEGLPVQVSVQVFAEEIRLPLVYD